MNCITNCVFCLALYRMALRAELKKQRMIVEENGIYSYSYGYICQHEWLLPVHHLEIWFLSYWEDENSASIHKATELLDNSPLNVGESCTVTFGRKKYTGKIAATVTPVFTARSTQLAMNGS